MELELNALMLLTETGLDVNSIAFPTAVELQVGTPGSRSRAAAPKNERNIAELKRRL